MEIATTKELNIKKDFNKGDIITLYTDEFDISNNKGTRKKIGKYIISKKTKNFKIPVDSFVNKFLNIDIYVHDNSGQLLDVSTVKILT